MGKKPSFPLQNDKTLLQVAVLSFLQEFLPLLPFLLQDPCVPCFSHASFLPKSVSFLTMSRYGVVFPSRGHGEGRVCSNTILCVVLAADLAAPRGSVLPPKSPVFLDVWFQRK